MLVYKNVTIGAFGALVVISDTVPKVQLMQTKGKRGHYQEGSPLFLSHKPPPKTHKELEGLYFPT